MPIRRLSRDIRLAVARAAMGEVRRAVLLGGLQYGALSEIVDGISSLAPRLSVSEFLTDGAMQWRTNIPVPRLKKVGPVRTSRESGQEFSFEFAAENIETYSGQLPQTDVQYALIQPAAPTTSDHGYLVDAASMSSAKGVEGCSQTVTTAGSIANQTWTLSVYVASLDQYQLATGALQVRMVIRRGDTTNPTTLLVPYTGAGKYQRLSITHLFSATAGTSIQVVISPQDGELDPLLIAAAQLELSASATAYERTSDTAAGVRNVLLGSHFPTRAPWGTTGSSYVMTPNSGRGPEVRAIVPPPGTMEFGVDTMGVAFPDGLMQMEPEDTFGQVADTVAATAATASGVKRVVTGLAPNFTFYASCWVRSKQTSTAPTGFHIKIDGQTGGGASLIATTSPDYAVTRVWRRVWWVLFVSSAHATMAQVEVSFNIAAGNSGKEVELVGLQFDRSAGDNKRPPNNYEKTVAAGGSFNSFQRSEEAENAYWTKTTATVTADTGYGPVEYYDVLHPSLGVAPARIRVNPWHNTPSLADLWQWPETVLNSRDNLFGAALSIGAYGSEKLGIYGNLSWDQERLVAGNLETLTGWTVSASNGTVALDSTPAKVHAGTFSAKFARTTTGGGGMILYQDHAGMVPGKWYLLDGWHVGDGTGAVADFILANLTAGQYLKADGTWAAGVQKYATPTPTTTYQRIQFWVQINAGFNLADTYRFEYESPIANAGGTNWWLDDVSFMGPYNTASLDDPVNPEGWTVGGTAARVRRARDLPDVWLDDEEAEPTDSVLLDVVGVEASPAAYIERTVALTAGWHTIRVRLAGASVSTGVGLRLSFKRSTDGFYLENDLVRFQTTTQVWTAPRGFRNWSDYPPSFGTAVWHLYVPTTTDYVLRFGGVTTVAANGTLRVDQIRIWDQAGALYASPADRTETSGNIAWLVQGLNVMFRGVASDITDGSEEGVSVRCRDYLHGTDQRIPVQTTRPECQLAFRGTECGYVSTTTFTAGSGGGTTHTASTALLEVGRYIKPKTGAAVALRIVSILDATHFTTDVGDTFLNGDLVSYVDCRKVYADCSRRQRTFRYLGTRAVATLQATIGTPYTRLIGPQPRPWSAEYDGPNEIIRSTAALMGALSISGQGALNDKRIFDDRAIPIVYGRKSCKLLPVESHATKFSTDASEWITIFYVAGWGELEEVRLLFTPDGPLRLNYAGGVGAYWHPGTQGEDAWWTLTDHESGSTENVFKIPNQRRDFRTNTDTTYNRMGYVVLQIKRGNSLVDFDDPTKVVELWGDIKGRKVQAYDSGGQPVGSPTWSRNPAWIMVDLLTNRLFGPGLPGSMIDWFAFKTAADICDVVITSGSAITTIRSGSNSQVQQVTSVADFAPEMNVLINASLSRKVLFVDPINQRLFFDSVVNSTTGWVVQGLPARYTCDLNIQTATPLATVCELIASTCRGMITFDGGKIGLQIEKGRADASATTWALATPTVAFRGVLQDSFRLNQRRGEKQAYNVLEVSYEAGQLLAGAAKTARFTDADQGGLNFPRPVKLDASGCDTADQALRATLPRFAKFCSTQASGSSGQAVGFTVGTGPAALAAQVGDLVTVTRTNRPPIGKSRVQTITLTPDLHVELEAIPEAAAVRPEGFIPTFDPFTDNPSAAAEQGTYIATAAILLTVVQSAAGQLKATVGLSGYTAGPGSSAGDHVQKLTALDLHADTVAAFTPAFGKHQLGGTHVAFMDTLSKEFLWNVPESLMEIPIYIKVVGYQGHIWQDPVFSNEVSATVYRVTRDTTDPTQDQVNSQHNMVYDGDFKGTEFQDGGGATPTKTGDGWSLNSTVTYTRVAPNSNTTPSGSYGVDFDAAFTTPTNGYDNNVGTVTVGTGIWVSAGPSETVASIKFGFAASTKTGRGKITCRVNANVGGQCELRYSTNGGGAWTTFAVCTALSNTDFYTPRVASQAMANFLLEVISRPRSSASNNNLATSVAEAQFDEETGGALVAHMSDDHLELKGDATNYAQAIRRFPGKSPPASGTYLTSDSLNTIRLRVKNHTAGVAANDDVEVRIEDSALGTTWAVLTVDQADIGDDWQDFVVLFDPGGTPVAGQLDIVVRYKGTNTVDCDWLGVWRGEQITAYNLGAEEQAAGKHPDLRAGESKNWPKGSWAAGVVRKTIVG